MGNNSIPKKWKINQYKKMGDNSIPKNGRTKRVNNQINPANAK